MGSMSAGMKSFVETAASKWFIQAWKDKVAGAFTDSASFSGDKLNTLIGLVINAMEHGMIFVCLGVMPSANQPEGMKRIDRPGPDTHPCRFVCRSDGSQLSGGSASGAGQG